MNLPYFGTTSPVVVIAAALIGIAVAAFSLKTARPTKFTRVIPCMLLGLYAAAIVVVAFARGPGADTSGDSSVNRFPIEDIVTAWTYNVTYMETQFILNVVLFIPFGILAPLVFKKLLSYWKIAVLAFGVSLAIEWLQWALPGMNRVFDLDDVLCNTAGSVIGCAIVQLKAALTGKREHSRRRGVCAAAICAAFVVFALRPVLHFPGEYRIPDSGYGNPETISVPANGALQIGISSLSAMGIDNAAEIASFADSNGAYSPNFERYGNFAKKHIRDIGRSPAVFDYSSMERAARRAEQGAVITTQLAEDAISVVPKTVEVRSGKPCYVLSADHTMLLPAWDLLCEITEVQPGYSSDTAITDLQRPNIHLILPA